MFRFVVGIFLLVVAVVAFIAKAVLNSKVKRARKELDQTEDIYEKRDLREQLTAIESNPQFARMIGLVALGLGLLFGFWSTVRIVPANTVGIPTTFGSIGSPMQSGFHITAPWTDVNTFSTRIQELSMLKAVDEGDKAKDDSIEIIADGGGSMSVDLTVRYSIIGEQAAVLFKQAGSMDLIKDRFVRPDAREVTRNVFALYSAEDGYSTKRAEIALLITEQLRERLETRGIIIDSVNVRDVLPEAQVLSAINAILQTRNEATKALEDQKKQVTEAETRKQVAERDKDATITKAEADAEAVRIAAEAQANANALIAASLTPELVELEKAKACAEAIAKTGATVVNVCGDMSNANTESSPDGTAVIVDARPTS